MTAELVVGGAAAAVTVLYWWGRYRYSAGHAKGYAEGSADAVRRGQADDEARAYEIINARAAHGERVLDDDRSVRDDIFRD